MSKQQYPKLIIAALVLLLAAALSGCSRGAKAVSSQAAEQAAPVVHVNMVNAKGQAVGSAVLTQTQQGVRLNVEVSGLTPGEHGIHFHQMGKCEPADFKTAGDHLNPTGKKHGLQNPEGPHAGDLPNLTVGADGIAKAEFVTKLVTLEKNKPNSLLKAGGTALIIHEKQDDEKTDPSGNSGSRVICGVIQ